MTELVFILDRSGSMAGLEADTIGGFNSMIAKQKKEAGEALVSTILFSNDSVVIHDRLPLSEVPPMTEKEYFTRGCTALLDAVGGAIHHIGNIHKYARREDVPEKTLFIITTDGCENASHRYSYETVHRMIELIVSGSSPSSYSTTSGFTRPPHLGHLGTSPSVSSSSSVYFAPHFWQVLRCTLPCSS